MKLEHSINMCACSPHLTGEKSEAQTFLPCPRQVWETEAGHSSCCPLTDCTTISVHSVSHALISSARLGGRTPRVAPSGLGTRRCLNPSVSEEHLPVQLESVNACSVAACCVFTCAARRKISFRKLGILVLNHSWLMWKWQVSTERETPGWLAEVAELWAS